MAIHRWYLVAGILVAFWLQGTLWRGGLGLAQTFQNRTSAFFPGGTQNGQAAWGDFDGDGWVDVALNGRVYRNNGGASFAVTHDTNGRSIWGDYNNDGTLDLFDFTHKQIWRRDENSPSGFVLEEIIPPGATSGVSLGAVWADLNNDAYLDLYVGGYEQWSTQTTYPDRILTYNEITAEFDKTWEETVYRARGVTAADFDRDADQDVYLSNYRLQPNRLWQNNGAGGMTDVAHGYGAAGTEQSGAYGHTIGSSWGDFDNDGYLDLVVGNFSHPASYQDRPQFLRNLGPSGDFHFQLKDTLDGSGWVESYASPALADFDNDGDLDVFLTAVYAGDNSRLYRNDGNWNFTNVTGSHGLSGLGDYQAAWADADNDGDLDLFTDGKFFLNTTTQSNGNHWLKVRLQGDGSAVNRAAIGAQVRVYTAGQVITRQVEGATGQGNQNDLTLHFGLGRDGGPVTVEILWPNAAVQAIGGVESDRLFERTLETVVGGEAVFSDDLENDAVGGPPSWSQAAGPWHAKDNGTWSSSNKVVDGIGAGEPAPVQGSTKYLLLDRAVNRGSDGRAYLSDFEGGYITRGAAAASFMLYIPSTNDVSANGAADGTIGLGDRLVGGGLSVVLGFENESGVFTIDYYDFGTNDWEPTAVRYKYDQWQRWDMTLDVNTGEATLRVDDFFHSWNVGRTGFAVDRVEFEAGWAGLGASVHNKMYLDAITDPSVPGALVITHNGSVVQRDDFEDDAVGGAPSWKPMVGPWHAKNNGAWSPNNKVVDGSGAGDPDPPPGSTKYLLLDRAGNNGSDGRAYLGNLAEGNITSGTAGASFMLYLPSTNQTSANNSQEAVFGLGPSLSGGLYIALGRADAGGTGAVEHYHASNGWTDTGLSYSQDLWQRWQVTVDLDTGDAILTVGTLSAEFSIGRAGFTVDRVEFEAGWAGSGASVHNKMYIDTVPEPSAAVMLAAGGLAVAAFYRRRRKE